jgi:hypothetical protein
MPRLNGAVAATILKEDMPETPVILFTMYPDLVADSLCAAIGVDFIFQRQTVFRSCWNVLTLCSRLIRHRKLGASEAKL